MRKILIMTVSLICAAGVQANVTATFTGSTVDSPAGYDGNMTTAANLNNGTTGGTWSGLTTSGGTTQIKVANDGTTLGTDNFLLIGKFGNDTAQITAATLDLDSAMTLADATISFNSSMQGYGGQNGVMFVDLFDGSTQVLRIALGNGGDVTGESYRGTIAHYSAIGTDKFVDNATMLSSNRGDVWDAGGDEAAVSLSLGASSFGVTTTGGKNANINSSGLSYFSGASASTTFDSVVFSSEGSKAAWGLDDISVIPEPATMGMITLFGGGILFIRRKLAM